MILRFIGYVKLIYRGTQREYSSKPLIHSIVERVLEGRGKGSYISFLPNFFGRFSLLPDFSPFSLISLLRGLFYLLLHRSASFPRVLKEGKHTKHVCHVDISPSSHTTFRFCHVSLKL